VVHPCRRLALRSQEDRKAKRGGDKPRPVRRDAASRPVLGPPGKRRTPHAPGQSSQRSITAAGGVRGAGRRRGEPPLRRGGLRGPASPPVLPVKDLPGPGEAPGRRAGASASPPAERTQVIGEGIAG